MDYGSALDAYSKLVGSQKLDAVRKWMRLVEQMQSEFGCCQKLEVKAEEDDGK